MQTMLDRAKQEPARGAHAVIPIPRGIMQMPRETRQHMGAILKGIPAARHIPAEHTLRAHEIIPKVPPPTRHKRAGIPTEQQVVEQVIASDPAPQARQDTLPTTAARTPNIPMPQAVHPRDRHPAATVPSKPSPHAPPRHTPPASAAMHATAAAAARTESAPTPHTRTTGMAMHRASTMHVIGAQTTWTRQAGRVPIRQNPSTPDTRTDPTSNAPTIQMSVTATARTASATSNAHPIGSRIIANSGNSIENIAHIQPGGERNQHTTPSTMLNIGNATIPAMPPMRQVPA
jgi:hypothetical protein